ncbi:MAG: hypothetical protein MJ206_01060 [Bacilli bacterium]|nr:hypothetical protein [Bacilli bacterium]
MKGKVYLLLAVLATPSLFGCQNNTICSFVFNSDYLLLNNERHYQKDEKKPVTLTLKLQEGYVPPTADLPFPDDLTVLIGERVGEKGKDYEYKFNDDKESATLSLPIVDDITVTAYKDNSDNYFHVNEQTFIQAVTMADPEIEYAQRSYESGVVSSGSIASLQYLEDYISPTIYHKFSRRIDATGNIVYPAEESYVKKMNEDEYVKKTREGWKEWSEEKSAEADEFLKPTNFSVKQQLDAREITYDTIKDSYDQERHGYFFTGTFASKPYTYALAFYKNRLTFFAYEYFSEDTHTIYGTMNFTYGTIQPIYPPDSEVK